MASVGPLVVIVGETASGKTALAIELAEIFNGEIICADSRTVYKGLDIGTAKPTKEEQSKVSHHLLDVVMPDQSFTAADFKRLALDVIEDIHARGKLPIMAGGSGLYIDAVIYDYGFSAKDAPRNEQNPAHVDKSVPRIKSEVRPNTLIIGLKNERDTLKKKISERVGAMVDSGLIDEIARIKQEYPNSKALLAPGYKAFSEYLDGKITLEEAKALFVRNDMQLAKRQRTWFKRNISIHWLNNSGQAVEITTTFLNKNTD